MAESSAVVSQNKGMVTATGIRLAYEPAAQKMETEAEELNRKLGSQGWSYKVNYDNSKPYDEFRAEQGHMDD